MDETIKVRTKLGNNDVELEMSSEQFMKLWTGNEPATTENKVLKQYSGWTPELRSRVDNYRQKGFDFDEIAVRTGLSRRAIAVHFGIIARKNNITEPNPKNGCVRRKRQARKNKQWSNNEDLQLLLYAKQGMKRRKIAKLLGRTVCGVGMRQHFMKKRGRI